MLKSDYDRLTKDRTPLACIAECHRMARVERDNETRAYASPSGGDQAEAPRHGFAADLYCLLGAGADPDEAWAHVTSAWTRYASEQRDRVERAPKLKRGPMAGQSSLHYRWVSDDLTWAYHVMAMVKILTERSAA